MFTSPTQAKLQEIGPRFTLKMRWLKKGLPSVTAPDGRIANGGDANEGNYDDAEVEKQEKADEDEAMGELGKAPAQNTDQRPVIPPLDEEQEYEWKWKVSRPYTMLVWMRLLIPCSPRWRFRDAHSSCRLVDPCMYLTLTLCGPFQSPRSAVRPKSTSTSLVLPFTSHLTSA